jgi:HEAT repeat protein
MNRFRTLESRLPRVALMVALAAVGTGRGPALAADPAPATAASVTTAADLPAVLPYGVSNLPASPVQRVNATSPRVIDLLGARVADPYVPYRVQVQSELGVCELPAGAPYVRKGLADPEPLVRAAAARAAGRVNDPSLAGDLKKAVADPDPRVRRAAVLSGAALGDGALIDAGLSDADPSVVMAAVSVAGASQADRLIAALPNDPPATQVAVLRALGRIGDARHAAAAAGFLTAGVPLRAAAVTAIGDMIAAAEAPAALKLLGDPHPTVRRAALAAAARLVSADDLHKDCIKALSDSDLSVRQQAAELLKQSPSADAIAALVANLPSDSPRLHATARDALVAIGSPIIPTAHTMLTDADARRREDASYLLGHLKSDAGLEAHIALINDPDWGVVKQAATSLGQIGRKEAIPAIAALAQRAAEPVEKLPKDHASDVLSAIEQAIVSAAELGDRSVLPVCKSIVPKSKTVSSNVRGAAVYAIGRLDDPSDAALRRLLGHPMGDEEESPDVQAECLKAMGHLKLKIATPYIGTTRETAKFTGDEHVDWLCYWVRTQVLGPQGPLTPVPEPWEATTSVKPLAD